MDWKQLRMKNFRELLYKIISSWLEALILSTLYGWLFMLMVGMIHANWLHALPTIGYWHSVPIMFVFRMIIAQASSTTKEMKTVVIKAIS